MRQLKPPAGIQLNRNHPLARGLVGCWLFNESSGLRVNDLCNMNPGTLTNFEPFSSTSKWTGGNNGTALQFDGTNDYVDCGNRDNLNITGTLTIDALITVTTPNKPCVIISKSKGNGSTFTPYTFKTDGTNPPHLQLVISSLVTGAAASVNTIPLNTQTHVAVTINDNLQCVFYINGQPESPILFGVMPLTNSNSVTIGALNNITNIFKGTISLVRIWNNTKSSQEVQQLYAQPYSMFK